MSLPPTPASTSLPGPPSRWSSLLPFDGRNGGRSSSSPISSSSPGPPLRSSLPPSPQMTSLPGLPLMWSTPGLPTMTSSPGVPLMCPAPTIVAGTFAGRARRQASLCRCARQQRHGEEQRAPRTIRDFFIPLPLSKKPGAARRAMHSSWHRPGWIQDSQRRSSSSRFFSSNSLCVSRPRSRSSASLLSAESSSSAERL